MKLIHLQKLHQLLSNFGLFDKAAVEVLDKWAFPSVKHFPATGGVLAETSPNSTGSSGANCSFEGPKLVRGNYPKTTEMCQNRNY